MIISADGRTVSYAIPPDYLRSRYRGALHALRKVAPFEALAFRGVSGALLAYPLAALLRIPVIHVRKRDESPGTAALASGHCPGATHPGIKRYIAVDSFLCTGATIKAIQEGVPGAECAAVLLYEDSSNRLRGLREVCGIPVIYVTEDAE